MRERRSIEVNVLGYRIERVQAFDDQGDVASQRYEVLAPGTQTLLGSFAQRVEAERAVIARELAALPRSAAA